MRDEVVRRLNKLVDEIEQIYGQFTATMKDIQQGFKAVMQLQITLDKVQANLFAIARELELKERKKD